MTGDATHEGHPHPAGSFENLSEKGLHAQTARTIALETTVPAVIVQGSSGNEAKTVEALTRPAPRSLPAPTGRDGRLGNNTGVQKVLHSITFRPLASCSAHPTITSAVVSSQARQDASFVYRASRIDSEVCSAQKTGTDECTCAMTADSVFTRGAVRARFQRIVRRERSNRSPCPMIH